jgi:hypothetical protein
MATSFRGYARTGCNVRFHLTMCLSPGDNRMQQIFQPDASKHLCADPISDAVDDFGPILRRVNMDAEGPLAGRGGRIICGGCKVGAWPHTSPTTTSRQILAPARSLKFWRNIARHRRPYRFSIRIADGSRFACEYSSTGWHANSRSIQRSRLHKHDHDLHAELHQRFNGVQIDECLAVTLAQ